MLSLYIYTYIQVLNHPVSTLPIHNINVAFAGFHARDGTCGATPQWFGARFGSGGTAGVKALNHMSSGAKSGECFAVGDELLPQLLFFFGWMLTRSFFKSKTPGSPGKNYDDKFQGSKKLRGNDHRIHSTLGCCTPACSLFMQLGTSGGCLGGGGVDLGRCDSLRWRVGWLMKSLASLSSTSSANDMDVCENSGFSPQNNPF